MPKESLTVFGSTVLSLMLEKGVRTETAPRRLLEKKEGLKVSQAGLTGWLYRRYGVTKDFPPAFARALNLDEQQKWRLAWEYTFGQDERLTIDDL